MTRMPRLLLLISICATTSALKLTATRRALAGRAAAAASSLALTRPGNAARGAAELDAEYYAKSALNKLRGTSPDVFAARQARVAPVAAAPRAVSPAFADAISSAATKAIAAAANNANVAAVRASAAARAPAERKALAARAARDLDLGATTDALGADMLALFAEASERLSDRGSRAAYCAAVGDALLALANVPAAPEPSLAKIVGGAEDVLRFFKESGYVSSAKLAFEQGGLGEAAEDYRDGYEVKVSASLDGAASILPDSVLEERGVSWHPDFCALALARYFALRGATCAAPTPHGFDEFLLDDVYRDDPRAFSATTLLALFTLAPPPKR